MFCIHCGAKLAENSKFCPICGNAVAAAPAVQPTAAQPGYSAPVYSYPVYVMPAAPAQPAAPTQPVQPAAPAGTYAAPVSAAEGVPVYRQNAHSAQPAFQKSEPVPPAAASAAVCGSDATDGDVVPEPQPEDPRAPLTVWQTIVCLLALLCLPIGNIIFACVWGFRTNEHPQRRTLARAALPFIAIGLVALFCGLLWLVLNMHSISLTIR